VKRERRQDPGGFKNPRGLLQQEELIEVRSETSNVNRQSAIVKRESDGNKWAATLNFKH